MSLDFDLYSKVNVNEMRAPVHLDLNYYRRLWKPNDLWRLATAAFNLDIHIDYVYDLVVRYMKNVIKEFPDGYLGPTNVGFTCDMAGWPMRQALPFSRDVMHAASWNYWCFKPHDGFHSYHVASDKVRDYLLARYPADYQGDVMYGPTGSFVKMQYAVNQKVLCCTAVRDLDQWKYYIENSDPRIGEGKWCAVRPHTGPRPHSIEEVHARYGKDATLEDILAARKGPDGPEYHVPYGQFPKSLGKILADGIGDKPWMEVVRDWNLANPEEAEKCRQYTRKVDENGVPRKYEYDDIPKAALQSLEALMGME